MSVNNRLKKFRNSLDSLIIENQNKKKKQAISLIINSLQRPMNDVLRSVNEPINFVLSQIQVK